MKIKKQLEFLKEIDKAKGIYRATLVLNGERQENDAEHSWHMALVATTFHEYATEEIDMGKVIRLILLHDLVEIYAGDTPAFGEGNPNKFQEELDAAEKIFSMLPEEQYKEYLALWLEFENKDTPESRFANGVDRFQGFLQNIMSDGHSWRVYSPSYERVIKRMEPIKEYLPRVYYEIVLPEIDRYASLDVIKRDR